MGDDSYRSGYRRSLRHKATPVRLPVNVEQCDCAYRTLSAVHEMPTKSRQGFCVSDVKFERWIQSSCQLDHGDREVEADYITPSLAAEAAT